MNHQTWGTRTAIRRTQAWIMSQRCSILRLGTRSAPLRTCPTLGQSRTVFLVLFLLFFAFVFGMTIPPLMKFNSHDWSIFSYKNSRAGLRLWMWYIIICLPNSLSPRPLALMTFDQQTFVLERTWPDQRPWTGTDHIHKTKWSLWPIWWYDKTSTQHLGKERVDTRAFSC